MPLEQIVWRGRIFNQRTIDMLEAAERLMGSQLAITQGSYTGGAVVQSFGTHDGGGAVDCWPVQGLVVAEQAIAAMRAVGFAAWVRDPSQGDWNYHIHAIAIGDPELSSSAANQVTEYYAGFNGLSGDALDNHPRPNPIPVWDGTAPPSGTPGTPGAGGLLVGVVGDIGPGAIGPEEATYWPFDPATAGVVPTEIGELQVSFTPVSEPCILFYRYAATENGCITFDTSLSVTDTGEPLTVYMDEDYFGTDVNTVEAPEVGTAFFTYEGESFVVALHVAAQVTPFTNGEQVYETFYTGAYSTYAEFEAEVILQYGSMDAFLAVLADFGMGVPGDVTGGVVLRVSEVHGMDTAFLHKVDDLQTFEELPTGVVYNNFPTDDQLTDNGITWGLFEKYCTEITSDRSHSGGKSLRRASPHLPNGGWQLNQINGPTARRPYGNNGFMSGQYARMEYWQYLNPAYPSSPYWHINDYYQGLHFAFHPGALDVGVGVNVNGFGGTAPLYVSDTLIFRIQPPDETNFGMLGLDTGVSPWGRWLKHVVAIDFHEDYVRLEIHDEGGELWSYETATTSFTDGGSAVDSARLSFQFARINDVNNQWPQVAPGDFMDWYDDVVTESGDWLPTSPEVQDVTLLYFQEEIDGEFDLSRRRFA